MNSTLLNACLEVIHVQSPAALSSSQRTKQSSCLEGRLLDSCQGFTKTHKAPPEDPVRRGNPARCSLWLSNENWPQLRNNLYFSSLTKPAEKLKNTMADRYPLILLKYQQGVASNALNLVNETLGGQWVYNYYPSPIKSFSK